MITVTFSEFSVSINRLKRICFRFRMISVTSSITPLIVENSCSTPSILMDVIANPSREERSILLSAFPMVIPKPGSSGRNSNTPRRSSDSSMITLSGFWNGKIAIIRCLKGLYQNEFPLFRIQFDDKLFPDIFRYLGTFRIAHEFSG